MGRSGRTAPVFFAAAESRIFCEGENSMKSTRVRAVVAAAALGLMASVVPLSAQWSFQADTMSKYIWRGFDLYADDNPAFQPSVTYTFGESGFSLNLWTSFALGERSIYKYDDEFDLTLAYDFQISENFDLSVGFTHYGWYFDRNFSFKNSTSQEFFVSVGLSKAFLEPLLTIFYDVSMGSGLYALLEGGHTIALSETVDLNLSAGLGYNYHQFTDESGLSDLTLSLSLPVKLGEWKIAPQVNYTFVFLETVNPENEFWFGLSIIR
jgi:hypothetical protein